MSLPLGLANPYTDAPAPAPPPQGQTGSSSDFHISTDPIGQPAGPFFAATEAEVREAMENPEPPQELQNPGGFLSTAPGTQTTAQGQGAPQGQGQGQANPAQSPQTQNPGMASTGQTVQQLQAELRNIPRDSESLYYQLIAGGMPEPQARQNVTVAAQLYKADLEQKLLLTQLSGPMRDVTATDIARRHSIPGQVTITAQDLVNEKSPEAMEARARAIAETRRDARVATRAQARVDVAESSGGLTAGAATASRQMTPFELIRSGLKGRRN